MLPHHHVPVLATPPHDAPMQEKDERLVEEEMNKLLKVFGRYAPASGPRTDKRVRLQVRREAKPTRPKLNQLQIQSQNGRGGCLFRHLK